LRLLLLLVIAAAAAAPSAAAVGVTAVGDCFEERLPLLPLLLLTAPVGDCCL